MTTEKRRKQNRESQRRYAAKLKALGTPKKDTRTYSDRAEYNREYQRKRRLRLKEEGR